MANPRAFRAQLVNMWAYRYNGASQAGVIPMRMESVEAMEFLSEQVHKRPRPPAPKMQLHLTAARRPSSPT